MPENLSQIRDVADESKSAPRDPPHISTRKAMHAHTHQNGA